MGFSHYFLKSKDTTHNTSELKCVKTTSPLLYILLSCVLKLFQMFPKMFKQGGILILLVVCRNNSQGN